jgi:hypothetical protein
VAERPIVYVGAALGGLGVLACLGGLIGAWRWERSNERHMREIVEGLSGCPAASVRVTSANPIFDVYHVNVCGKRGKLEALFPDGGWALWDDSGHLWRGRELQEEH